MGIKLKFSVGVYLDVQLQREEGLHGVRDVVVVRAVQAVARAAAEDVRHGRAPRRPAPLHRAAVTRSHHLEHTHIYMYLDLKQFR